VFDQMAGRYNQQAGPNLGVYLKGHAGDLLKVDRRGRPPEYLTDDKCAEQREAAESAGSLDQS
jgi:hypothetical protein